MKYLTDEQVKEVLAALEASLNCSKGPYMPYKINAAIRTLEAAEVAPDERVAFEEWARRTHTRPGTHFSQSHNGVYKDNRIAAKWAAWQARAAMSAPVATVDDVLNEMQPGGALYQPNQIMEERAASARPVEPMPRLPATPEKVIAFIGSNFDAHHDVGPVEDQRFTLSVHDLLSAFGEWEPVEQEPVAYDVVYDGESAGNIFLTMKRADEHKRHMDIAYPGHERLIRPLYAAPQAPQALVPEGWKLVPVSPTPEMLSVLVYEKYPEDFNSAKQAQARGIDIPRKTEYEMAYGQYQRMLAAAPEPK